MNLRFLGGAEDIGSTALVLRKGNFTCIFEYGLKPSDPPEYPMEPPPVDYVFLTHAHLDHSGMIPYIITKSEATLFTTEITHALSKILLRDNLKICKLEGYPRMYTKADINDLVEYLHLVKIGSNYSLQNCELGVHSAGHIPGAAMFQLNFNDDTNFLFTGDINTIDTRLISGTAGRKCDVLVMEATYAGRNHELRPKIEYNFIEKVKEIIENGGKVVVPAFAVGRTQEMLLVLGDLDYEVWLDGLGEDVTKLLLRLPMEKKVKKKLKNAFQKVNKIRNDSHRTRAVNGDIILTTSGMLDGGPVLRYIKELNNERNAILLTGYQVEHSNGRLLLNKGIIDMYGTHEKVNMEVQFFDFSAHAGHNELINFVRSCDPEHVVLFHSDNRELMLEDLDDSYQVYRPVVGETLEI